MTRAPKLMSFILNSFINAVRCPDLMKLWGYWKHDKCKLCGKEGCSLIHILTSCIVALNQKRYTWRHDSVLNTLRPTLEKLVAKHNIAPASTTSRLTQPFVKAGQAPKGKGTRAQHSLLSKAKDWKILVDFEDHEIVFPPTILSTALRPDIIIWSEREKIVI